MTKKNACVLMALGVFLVVTTVVLQSSAEVTVGTTQVTTQPSDTIYKEIVKWITVPKSKWNDPGFADTNTVATIKLLEEQSRRTILDKMITTGGGAFIFKDKYDAAITVEMRLTMVKTIDDMVNARIKFYYYSATQPATAPAGWKAGDLKLDVIVDGVTKKMPVFVIRTVPNTLPYDALLSMKNGTTRGECFSAIGFAVFWSAADAYDKYGFRATFNGKYPGIMSLTTIHLLSQMSVVSLTGNGPVVPGDWLYMENPGYMERMRQLYVEARQRGDFTRSENGGWNGENVICVGYNANGDLLYTGLGHPGETANKTEEELRKLLKDKYKAACNNEEHPDPTKIKFTKHLRPCASMPAS